MSIKYTDKKQSWKVLKWNNIYSGGHAPEY